jgi:chemotaxis protein methyltransferase CheR
MSFDELFDIEMRLLLEGVRQVHGHDFTEYAEASLKRRVSKWFAESRFKTLSEAQSCVLREPEMLDSLLRGITVNVSEMFRDPSFFKAFREQVVPHLRTWPYVKIWLAGCATGEEAYSLAILLEEEGLADRSRIYATDLNNVVLETARKGIYPLRDMQRYTRNYQAAGGKAAFSDYYTARYDHAMMMPRLSERMVFASHNLATDAAFGEMQAVFCRNVLIYFRPSLKERVLSLFDSCISPGGFLCLGLKEGIEAREIGRRYEEIAARMRIYRKRYGSPKKE